MQVLPSKCLSSKSQLVAPARCQSHIPFRSINSVQKFQSRGRIVLHAAAAESTDKSLEELNKDSFYPFLEKAGDRLVVVDFYTDWCGPCKVMLPVLEDMAQELKENVDIVKFNCNAANKEIGKELNIRVAPTFHLYKNNNKVAEMTGAKVEQLRELIDSNK